MALLQVICWAIISITRIQKKLIKEPELLREYENIIIEQKRSGIVEEIPIEECMGNNKEDVGVHYIPPHCVIRADRKTTKLRVVYDGSANPDDAKISPNDSLLTGPNFIPHVSLADTDPCKYTTLHSKALLILFSTSDNTLLNRCFCIYLTSIKSRLCLMHATMISDTPTCHLSVPTYYTSQINYLYFTA